MAYSFTKINQKIKVEIDFPLDTIQEGILKLSDEMWRKLPQFMLSDNKELLSSFNSIIPELDISKTSVKCEEYRKIFTGIGCDIAKSSIDDETYVFKVQSCCEETLFDKLYKKIGSFYLQAQINMFLYNIDHAIFYNFINSHQHKVLSFQMSKDIDFISTIIDMMKKSSKQTFCYDKAQIFDIKLLTILSESLEELRQKEQAEAITIRRRTITRIVPNPNYNGFGHCMALGCNSCEMCEEETSESITDSNTNSDTNTDTEAWENDFKDSDSSYSDNCQSDNDNDDKDE